MIKYDNLRVSGRNHRWAKYISWVRDAFVNASERDFLHANQVISRIEQNHAQRLFSQSAHLWANELVRQFGRVDFLFDPFFPREAVTKPEGSDKLNCFREFDSFDL